MTMRRALKWIMSPLLISLWFIALTFPIIVLRVDTRTDLMEWRWTRLIWLGIGSFLFSVAWRHLFATGSVRLNLLGVSKRMSGLIGALRLKTRLQRRIGIGIAGLAAILAPFFLSLYHVSVFNSALSFIVLGLGLNIIIGLGGMLHLGYIALYAIGAYTYGLLHHYFGVGFWMALPVGALAAMLVSILIGIPTLHLRGDYLAIVTLAFGEIVRIVLNNWTGFTLGAGGISGIDYPTLFGISFNLRGSVIFIYFILFVIVIASIFVTWRLARSRIGREWEAMKEDETAARCMGVNPTQTKLTALAVGGLLAGIVGVVFAARTTFINPASFTVWESIIVLCAVVLGGLGSIPGVIVGASILILLPEYLRFLQDFRLLIFGVVLVFMMIFRPQGLIPVRRQIYRAPVGEPDSD